MQLQFFGATGEVTGSCFLLTTKDSRVLIDCGLIQGSYQQEKRNFEPFPFNLATIDAIILTHAHIDHSGKLPLAIKSGFKGPIYTHPATRDLCNIMLQDAGFLNEKDVESANKKRERKGLELLEPLYSVEDAKKAIEYFSPIEYQVVKQILPDIKICFQDAGHILGSAIVELWVEEGGVKRKIVFSGDLGRKNMPILRDPTIISHADLVVMESTYGDRKLPGWSETVDIFKDILQQARKSRGNILIPSFAVGRTQEVLYLFYENFTEYDLEKALIFLDSPMAIEVTEVYTEHWKLYDKTAKQIAKNIGNPYHLPNLRLTVSTQESMAINQIKQGGIIIAGSGMCDGGRIRHHIKHNIWRRDSHLIFVGYQAEGTLGRKILDGAKQISLWGERIKVAAHIHSIEGFSAHADQSALLSWYGQFESLPALALVHGETQAIEELQQKVYEQFTVHPIVPKYKTQIDLVKLKVID